MKLSEKLHTALDELRMQMLGAQVIFGFNSNASSRRSSNSVSHDATIAVIVAFALIVITIGCLLAPAAQHRLVEKGEASGRLMRTAALFSGLALTAYGLALRLRRIRRYSAL